MDKIIVSITAVAILLIFILVSHLWYRLSVPTTQDDILYVMRIPHSELLIGILGLLFFSAMAIPSIILLEDNWFLAFAVFYLFILWGEYWCIMVFLWRCAIREDSLTIYMPLLPAKKIHFHEIEYVYCTDNQTFGMSGKKLEGYRGQKKLFSIEEEIYGFPLLYELLYERGKVGYVPVMENLKKEDTLQRVPLVESFTVSEKTEDKVRTVLIDLVFIIPCMAYILWNRKEFELFYQVAALIMLLLFLPNAFSTLLWKVTMDYQTLSIRTFPGITRTYEIRKITKVIELENFVVLYVGEKKIAKIAKSSKNFPYLFERLLQTEAEIYRKL